MTPLSQQILEACEFNMTMGTAFTIRQATPTSAMNTQLKEIFAGARNENQRLLPIITKLLEANEAMEKAIEENGRNLQLMGGGRLMLEYNNEVLEANTKRMREIGGRSE